MPQNKMERYANKSGNLPITHYEDVMKTLAASGSGLSAYITKNVGVIK